MTVPRTWVTNELVPASTMNTHVRDMLNAIAIAKALVIGIGDVNGVVLTTGVKAYFEVPMAIRITGWTLLGDVSGSIVLDIWKTTFGSFAPPTHPAVSDTITGSEKPTLSAAQKAQDLTLTTWTTDLAVGDILAINVDSVATLKAVTLTLRGTLLALV